MLTNVVEEGMVIPANLGQVPLIHTPQGDVFITEKPCGQTAELPFTADVRTGPENHIQSQLGSLVNIGGQIQHTSKVENAFLRLVEVPASIGFHRIEAALL